MISKSEVRGESETVLEDWLSSLNIDREAHPHLHVHIISHAMQVILNNLASGEGIKKLEETCKNASANCKSSLINSESGKQFADLYEQEHMALDKSDAVISFTDNDHRKHTMNATEYEQILMNEAYCIACETALKALGEEPPPRAQDQRPSL